MLKDRVADVDEFVDSIGGSPAADWCSIRLSSRGWSTCRAGAARSTISLNGERDVLALMAEGRSNAAIAQRLFVTPKTVEAHTASIFSKLGLLPAGDDHRRVLAVLEYLRARD